MEKDNDTKIEKLRSYFNKVKNMNEEEFYEHMGYDKQRNTYGISDIMTWSIDGYVYPLILGLFNLYYDIAPVDMECHTLMYNGYTYTQKELLEEIINSLRIIIGTDSYEWCEYLNVFRKETWDKIGIILPYMWW